MCLENEFGLWVGVIYLGYQFSYKFRLLVSALGFEGWVICSGYRDGLWLKYIGQSYTVERWLWGFGSVKNFIVGLGCGFALYIKDVD